VKKLSLKASCLCGGIKLKTKGYHRNIQNCHCVQCVKTHGNYAAYTYVEEKNIKFLKKRTLRWFKSSKRAKRGFCNKCGAHTVPYIENKNSSSNIEHEATTSNISEEQLFYCNQRGLNQEEAVGMIVNGFCKEVLQQLPMEFAVEAQKLVGICLDGSVG